MMTTRARTVVAAAVVVASLAACSGSPDATSIAEGIAAELDGDQVITITDANDTLDRFDDEITSAAVIHVGGVDCTILGVACGAEINVSSDSEDEVRKVAAYTQAMMSDGGTDVDVYVKGQAVLYVSGKLDAGSAGIIVGEFGGEPANTAADDGDDTDDE